MSKVSNSINFKGRKWSKSGQKSNFWKQHFFTNWSNWKLWKKFSLCVIQFLRYPSPPGTPLGQNENEDAVPRVGILFFVQFPERGKILQWWPPPSWGGMGNAKIEWHIREKNFSKFPFRPIRIKMLVSKFWFLTNFYLVNFSQLNQKCGIVSSSSNSVVLIRKKNFQKFPLRPFREKIVSFGIV